MMKKGFLLEAFLILFLLLGLVNAEYVQCPPGQTYVGQYGCYYYGNELMTWIEAVGFCENMGGKLVRQERIHDDLSKKMQLFIYF